MSASVTYLLNVSSCCDSSSVPSLTLETSLSSLAEATELLRRRICRRFLGELTTEQPGLFKAEPVGVTGVDMGWVALIRRCLEPSASLSGAIKPPETTF